MFLRFADAMDMQVGWESGVGVRYRMFVPSLLYGVRPLGEDMEGGDVRSQGMLWGHRRKERTRSKGMMARHDL